MVKVQIPATTANVGPAFDCLGIALSMYNTVEAEFISDGLIIEVSGRDSQGVEKNEHNLVYRSMKYCFDQAGYRPRGLKIKQYNEIPISRGLGSSAACIVAGLMAANLLMDKYFNQQALLDMAVELEGHPDNVAPALLGGVVVSVRGAAHTDYIRFPVDPRLTFYTAVPDQGLSTELARSVLPESVFHQDAVHNVGKASLLVAALLSGELDKINSALKDQLHQPFRLKLMPSLEKIFKEAAGHKIENIFLSGAGPTVILLEWQEAGHVEGFKKILSHLPEKWELIALKGHN